MSLEIEHKYLVRNLSFIDMVSHSETIFQGYLSRTPDRVVRVRTIGERAYLTIKGVNHGDTRIEFEYSIPLEDAKQLFTLCQKPILKKTRHYVEFEGFKWEIDVYSGYLSPLITAEIELPTSDTPYPLPPFVGKNITGDPRYYNSNL